MNPKGKKSTLPKTLKNGHKKPGILNFKPTISLASKKSPVKKISNNQALIKKTVKVGKSPKTQPSRPSRSSFWLIIYTVIITVGISTILGTVISLASEFQPTVAESNQNINTVASNPKPEIKLDRLFSITALGKEINPLKLKLQELGQQYPSLKPEVFIADLDTKGFVNLEASNAIASASTIKLPILVAFFQDVDAGKISLSEKLTITKEDVATGSGDLQHKPIGTKLSALETAEKMMVISDNTATNMLIKRLGGQESLNQRFTKLGLTATKIRNPLPDLDGTNTTTPEDLGNLLINISNGELVSLRSRDRLLGIMRNIVRDTLLPQGLEPGAIIAHKTGDIASVLGDVGMIDMPNGKRYIAAILVKRPTNSFEAQEFIQKASRLTYQHFKYAQSSS
ncbi:hypothetical protein NIES4102_36230 [Chondrocystis sp. NIES-4102]|nr:hypothetical protein NIES4102_36230 [Chondrocystis sp. NIES-4102]